MSKKRFLSGIKPTGFPHIGNYAGMLLPMLQRAANTEYDVNIFIADYHSLNDANARKNLGGLSLELAATLLALGFDPKSCTFYRQSDVPETFELTSFLTNFTPKGLMNRAHAYKAAKAGGLSALDDEDMGINMGLYNYPILMSADILLFDADYVPVGRDQRQHIEIARDIAASVNAFYGEAVLKLPEGIISADTMEVPGIDGRKMSKSYGNQLPIFAPPAEVEKIVKRIKTDSKLPAEPKDEDNLLLKFHQAMATAEAHADFRKRFLPGGMGYGDAKKEVMAAHEARFGKARAEYERLMADAGYVNSILAEGAKKARDIAVPVLKRVRKAAGFST